MVNQEELINLIARCALKDSKAMKKLFESTAPLLNSVVLKIVHRQEVSSDVLQEAYLQIWQNAGQYQPAIASPLTWMVSIARYRALDKLDAERRHSSHLELNESEQELGSTASPLLSIELDEKQKAFELCLEELSDKVKNAIRLAYLHGYSREMLSEMFDTPLNTIKSWLKRGVEVLKLCIERKHGHEH